MSGLKCGDYGGEITVNPIFFKLCRLFLICRRRRLLKAAHNLPILLPRPRYLLIVVKQAKNVCIVSQIIGSGRCFGNFLVFYWFFAATAAVSLLGCLEKFLVQIERLFYVEKNYIKRTFRGKFIGGGGQIRASCPTVSLLWAACTTTAANVTNSSFK